MSGSDNDTILESNLAIVTMKKLLDVEAVDDGPSLRLYSYPSI